ncbi:MAG: hypothetical protein RQ855_03670, partial [Desulfurococcales archaeon]|nr:hypothetical protein [Desulfurococcales archaeon]
SNILRRKIKSWDGSRAEHSVQKPRLGLGTCCSRHNNGSVQGHVTSINKPPISIQVPSHFAYQLIFYLTASLFIILAIVLNTAGEVLRK